MRQPCLLDPTSSSSSCRTASEEAATMLMRCRPSEPLPSSRPANAVTAMYLQEKRSLCTPCLEPGMFVLRLSACRMANLLHTYHKRQLHR